MELLLASLISCADAQKMIEKIYASTYLDNETKIGLYESIRESTHEDCLADTPPTP